MCMLYSLYLISCLSRIRIRIRIEYKEYKEYNRIVPNPNHLQMISASISNLV